MRAITGMLLLLLASSPLGAKPKVDVKVRMNEGLGKNLPYEQISRGGQAGDGTLMQQQVYFLNVTVLSNNADAVAKNNGQWCIKGDTFLESFDYQATLSGNTLEVQVPQKNGKSRKVSFVIYDYKWRKLSDL